MFISFNSCVVAKSIIGPEDNFKGNAQLLMANKIITYKPSSNMFQNIIPVLLSKVS